LRACHGTHLLVFPCDLPWLDCALLELLRDQAQSQPERPCLVRTGEQWQPLLTVIPKALLPALQTAWNEGQRSPLRWLLNQSHAVVQLPPGDPRLHNANTLADWSVDC
jgi:molybdopterin-guanine dinucleotide biosynthesis protein A